MFWLVNLDDVLFAEFSAVAMPQLSVGGCKCWFQKGFGTFTLDSLFFLFLGFLKPQLLCCDAPACLMAELPGRPAGAWCSPVGSWVSAKPCPRCLPTSPLCSDTAVAVTNLVTWAAFIGPFLCVLLCSPGFVYVG